MKKCTKIAIIDSGFDFGSLLVNSIVDYKWFYGDTKEDDNGHGTSVVRIIDGLCVNCKFYILKVLDSEGRSDFQSIESAICYAVENKVDIINASFGIESNQYAEEINEICNEVYNRNIILVTTQANDKCKNYLYEHDKVLKVVGGKSIRENLLYYNDGVFFVMGMARMIPWLGKHYVLKGGNSFSLPLIIPYIIEAMYNGCECLNDVYVYLHKCAIKVDEVSSFYDTPIIKKQKISDINTFNTVSDYMVREGLRGKGNSILEKVYKLYTTEKILRDLENVFHCELPYEEFQYPEWSYIENISNKIYEILD